MITINSDESYTGKQIREEFAEDSVIQKFFSDEVIYKPKDDVYYFIKYVGEIEAILKTGSNKTAGFQLVRDLEKSPRRKKPKFNFWSRMLDVDTIYIQATEANGDELYKCIMCVDENIIYYADAKAPSNKEKFEKQLFKYLKKNYPEYF